MTKKKKPTCFREEKSQKEKPVDRIESFKKECSILISKSLDSKIRNYGDIKKISPIEKLFIIAFESERFVNTLLQNAELIHQHKIISNNDKIYYPDFCFNYYEGSNLVYNDLGLLIELDGHIWHEKTAEQVEKDKIRERDLINSGYRLMRFSGREVYRDPFKVLNECTEAYYGLVLDEKGASI